MIYITLYSINLIFINLFIYIFNYFLRETKSWEKDTQSKVMIRRRNTLDNIIFNEMCDKADKDYENEANRDITKEGNKKYKRSLKMLRGNERDLKLDIEAAYNYMEKFNPCEVSTPNHIKVQINRK